MSYRIINEIIKGGFGDRKVILLESVNHTQSSYLMMPEKWNSSALK